MYFPMSDNRKYLCNKDTVLFGKYVSFLVDKFVSLRLFLDRGEKENEARTEN